MIAMRLFLATVLLATLAIPVTSARATGNYPGNAVRVNNVNISYQRFMGFYQEYQRSQGVAIGARGDQLQLLSRLRSEAMDLLVDQELIRQAAREKDIEASPEEIDAALAEVSEPFEDPKDFYRLIETEGYSESGYREFLGQMIAASKYLDTIRAEATTVSDADLEAYYHDNEHRLTLPEQLRVRHILLTWKPLGKPDDRAALREQMAGILEKAHAGEDFAQLASTHSDDSTAKDGGDVGFFYRGQMVPAFEAAAFALQPGEISEIVETPFGVHILRLEERKGARLLPLEEVREQLREHISEERMEKVVEAEKKRLREEANIEILIPLKRADKG